MRVAVAAQRVAHRVAFGRRLLIEQPGQVGGLLACRGLGDDLGRGGADPRQRLQRARLQPPLELARRQVVDHLRGPAEGAHPVGWRPAPFQLERDPPQRLPWVHC